jgi:hypothetical protein
MNQNEIGTRIPLKGCPFCDSEEWPPALQYSTGFPEPWYVECGLCYAQGETAETAELAAKKWNTRPRESAGKTLAEEMIMTDTFILQDELLAKVAEHEAIVQVLRSKEEALANDLAQRRIEYNKACDEANLAQDRLYAFQMAASALRHEIEENS